MDARIRPVTAEDWSKVKDLRLAALRDPAAALAFPTTYADAAARPDTFWQRRAAGTGSRLTSHQLVAEEPDGHWIGTVTVVIEPAAADDAPPGAVSDGQAQLLGVYVRPEHRGTGVADALFVAAIACARGCGPPPITRIRLFVHQDNHRAEAFYRRAGFTRTGRSTPVRGDPAAVEHELLLR